jgi:hypothetical protein
MSSGEIVARPALAPDSEQLDIVLGAAENYLLYLQRIKPLKNVRIDGVVFDIITPEELREYTTEIDEAIKALDVYVQAAH